MSKRRQVVRHPSSRALIILAGLPRGLDAAVAERLSESLPDSPKLIAIPASSKDGSIYSNGYIESCLRATTEYAERQSVLAQGASAPAAITLAFVPDDTQDHLLEIFDFSVFPLPLVGLDEYELGKQKRHNLLFSQKRILALLKEARGGFGTLKRRMTSFSPRDPLFLPPLNFWVSQQFQLAGLLSEMREGNRDWSDPLGEVSSRMTSHTELPKHIFHGVKPIFVDNRGLLFPRDPSDHAPPRSLEVDATTLGRASLLRSCYRFGMPLPPGLHHDVQFIGRKLTGITFQCAEKGYVGGHGDYASVYPNDFVRV